jgi:hypothetical protein
MKNLFYYVLLASGFIAGFITYDSLEYASTGEWLSPFHALVACFCSMWFLFTTIIFINRSGKEEGYDPWSWKLPEDKNSNRELVESFDQHQEE